MCNMYRNEYLQKVYSWMRKCHAGIVDVVKPIAKPASDLMKWSGAFNLSEGVFWLDVITAAGKSGQVQGMSNSMQDA